MDLIKKPIVIFGASGGALKVAQTFDNLEVKYEFFVDNDSNKWGNEFAGKQIHPPERLLDHDYTIVIASDYQKEIEKQLTEMGLIDKLMLKEELIMDYVNQHKSELDMYTEKQINESKEKTIIIDLVEGIGLGGIETWSFLIADEMVKSGIKTLIYSKITNDTLPNNITNILRQFDLDYKRYWQSIKDLIYAIVNSLPCTILTNWQSQVMIAGLIVKEYFPDKIKIVSALHNDKIAIYRRQRFFNAKTDAIIAVSEKIKDQMIRHFSAAPEKVYYKESPVQFDEDFKKLYTLDSKKPIQIGFAARIDKFQKRADLLVKLIDELEKDEVNYQLNIAGIGNYYDKLKYFVEANKLEEHVKLLGLIDRKKMPDFWKENDIFLSISDFEGASISMLEAMSFGVVPIVTEVSGVSEFIANNVNGIICPCGDFPGIKKGIQLLNNNRHLLQEYGDICRSTVYMKCNKDEYIDYILKLIS